MTYFTAFFGIVLFAGVLFILELFAMNDESNVALKIPCVERYSGERMRREFKKIDGEIFFCRSDLGTATRQKSGLASSGR